MPAKKKKTSQPPPRKIVKTDFFVHPCHQAYEEFVPIDSKPAPEDSSSFPPPREQRRFFIYNKDTGEPYAEWINNVAISLETGEELFKSRNYQPENADWKDYSVPTFYRADDPTIYTEDLIRSGIISEQDLAVGNGFLTREKFAAWKASKSHGT